MTSLEWLRPVPVILLALLSGACGVASEEGRTFETWAQSVADIPVESAPGQRLSDRAGLRPAHSRPMRVEVMSTDQFWDERFGRMAETAVRTAPDAIVAAVHEVADEPTPSETAGLRPAETPQPAQAESPAVGRAVIQLGAYSSRQAAEAAWAGFQSGPAGSALRNRSPSFETVERDGRPLVRLRVAGLSSSEAAGLCGAVAAWCARS